MNAEKFVDILKMVVRDSSIDGITSVLKSPPGRRPKENLVLMSKYYNEASENEKEIIKEIIKLSVDNAIFGVLCVLDGVRAIEDGDKGELILTYRNNGEVILNKDEDLHDIYNAE